MGDGLKQRNIGIRILFSGTDGTHLILGLLGCVPVVGWVFDLADAAIYAFVDHDYNMATISLIGIVIEGAPLIVGAGALAIGKVGAKASDFFGAGKSVFKTMSSKIVDGISSMSSPVMKGVHKLGDIGSTIKTTAKQGIDKIYSGAKNVAKQSRDKVASMLKKGGGYQGRTPSVAKPNHGQGFSPKGYNPKPGERTFEGYVKNNVPRDVETKLFTNSSDFNTNPKNDGHFKRFGTKPDQHGIKGPHVHQPTRNVNPNNGVITGKPGKETKNGGVTVPGAKDVKQLYEYLENGKYH